jgi:hypothetical protein
MATRHRSARRRRLERRRGAQLAILFAIPVVLALVIAAVITVGGGSQSPVAETPVGDTQAPATAGAAASPAATGGAPIVTDAANVNCDIIVPANPLSAQGLATPYQLTGPGGMSPAQSGCEMTNAAALGAFVQATILDPATGKLSVYDPLVITKGTIPAIQPTVPAIPADAVVTVDFGFNGTDLFQVGATPTALKQGNCMNGMPGSIFGQVSFCNGTNFFTAAFQAEREGKLKVPSAGTSTTMVATDGALGTGKACPVTRNFDVVDQDPSDNVTTEYLLNPATGQTAQDTASNQGSLQGSTLLLNGSDNTLLDAFIDPVLGCRPYMAPDLANNDTPTTTQALDELLAAANQPKNAALVPENDGMVTDLAGSIDVAKTNLYRSEIGQAPVSAQNQASSSPQMFCQNLINIQGAFIAANQNLLTAQPSPVPTAGDSLYTFLASRLQGSFDNLNCANFGLHDPVSMSTNGAGAVDQATINTAPQTASF